MAVDERAGRLGASPGDLDGIARHLHGKDYIQLTDAEAATVWDYIEDSET